MKTVALFLLICSPALADIAACRGAHEAHDYDAEAVLRNCLPVAKQGNAEAQYNVGWHYFILAGASSAMTPSGPPPELREAVRWFRLAAEQGDADSQSMLGLLYGGFMGAAKDDAEAMKWYRKAADQGNAAAQFNIGDSYHEGRLVPFVPQNDAEAMKWYRKAADQGNPTAQYAVGRGYFNGRGVPQDFVLAYTWLNLAASQAVGEPGKSWVELRDTVAAKLTPTQMAEAQQRSREWKPSALRGTRDLRPE